MAEPYQTLFYELSTGKVLKIEPNLHIIKSKDKSRWIKDLHFQKVGIFYLDGDEPLNPDDLVVRQPGNFAVRVLMDKKGGIFDLNRVIDSYRKLCEKHDGVIFEAEGGLGDHLFEAAACLEYKAQNPGKFVALKIRPNYMAIIPRIKGLDEISTQIHSPAEGKKITKVSGHTQYMTDPRGLGFGKVSLYGTRLGLQSVQRIAYLEPTDEDYLKGEGFLRRWSRDPDRPLIGIQFRSGSGHGKSWQHEKVQGLVRLIYENTKAEVVVFGRNWEFPSDSPLGINLTGPYEWDATYWTALHCEFFVSVDSGIMHLARSLRKPCVGLWGGSTPEYILGESLGPYDIQLDLECKNRLCMDCPEHHCHCMDWISPELVFQKVKELLIERSIDND